MAAKSTTGLNKNTAGALCYVLPPVTGIIFLIMEKDKAVRFHAMQSIIAFIGFIVLQSVMTFTIILLPLVPLLIIVGFVFWLLLIYKAWQGDEWEVPMLGKYARKFVKKV